MITAGYPDTQTNYLADKAENIYRELIKGENIYQNGVVHSAQPQVEERQALQQPKLNVVIENSKAATSSCTQRRT